MRTLILLLSLFFGLTVPALAQGQQDVHAIGIQESMSGGFDLFRLDLQTEEFEILQHLPFDGLSQHCIVDTRNNLFCAFIHDADGRSRMLQFDLNTNSMGAILEPDIPHVLDAHYDPVGGNIYAITSSEYLHNETFLWRISTTDGRAVRVGELPGEAHECSGVLDYLRGVYYVFKADGEVLSQNLRSGQPRQKFNIQGTLASAHFEPSRGWIYGMMSFERQDNLNDARMVVFDPADYSLHALQNRSRGDDYINACGGALNGDDGSYIIALSNGQFAWYDLEGEPMHTTRTLGPEAKWIAGIVSGLNTQEQLTTVAGRLQSTGEGDCGDAETAELEGVAAVTVIVQPVGPQVLSDDSGRFNFALPPGSYWVEPLLDARWEGVCTESNTFFTVGGERETADLNILLQPKRRNIEDRTPEDDLPGVDDRPVIDPEMSVSFNCPQLISGRKFKYTITIKNTGIVPFNGELELNYDPLTSYVSAVPEPTSTERDRIVWKIEDMPARSVLEFNVGMSMPLIPGPRGFGPQVCAGARLFNVWDAPTEPTVENGGRGGAEDDGPEPLAEDGCCKRVLVAYDPNDISVSPAGFGERGILLPEDRELTYTIRFQNTGKAPAHNVVIRDTLDDDLDVTSLQFGEASHEYSADVLNGNILEFRFENIQLPDVETDDAGSHGSIEFTVHLNSGLPAAAEIHNRAAIYFDLNEPVLTNTVLNTIGETATDVAEFADQSVPELRSHSNGLFVLRAAGGLDGRLSVHSILGTTILEHRLDKVGEVDIDLRNQPSGRYMLRVENRGKVFVRQLVVIR